MDNSTTLLILFLCLLLLIFITHAHAHGLMTMPPQRGALTPNNKFNRKGMFPDAPADQKAHFPAGDKSSVPGAGARSQIHEAGDAGWSPFEPMTHGFKWRAGVCGDEKGGKQEHVRGGQFYYGGIISRTYPQGAVIDIEMNIVANHNGFMELHICDVAKCGGEISEACFKQGHCYQLLRAPNPSCDSGYDLRCAPRDPNYPGRWYLPCATKPENSQERFGGTKMQYQLPEGLACEHCVLHWFWSAANTCNPPGVITFYEGPHGPKNWGTCVGQGGARGGYSKVQKDCGKNRFPEEYYQCADVRITDKGGRSTSGMSTPSPMPTAEGETVGGKGVEREEPNSTSKPTPVPTRTPETGEVFRELVLVGDGKLVGRMRDGDEMDIGRFGRVAIEAVTFGEVGQVKFYLDGDLVWADNVRPYFMFGNKGRVPNYWNEPIVNRWFELKVMAKGGEVTVRIKLVK